MGGNRNLKVRLVGPTQTLGRRQFDSRDLNRTPSTHSRQEHAPGLLPKAVLTALLMTLPGRVYYKILPSKLRKK